jgi:short subunit dehydrogenase-like uncharacterized protein
LAAAKRVIVAGAGGVFGRLLVGELAELAPNAEVVATTRATLDIDDLESVSRAARGAFAVACTAGPFQTLDRRAVHTAVDAGAHWLDIADDPGWFFDLMEDRALDASARERGVAVISGLSSTPAISGALVRRLAREAKTSREGVVTLGIGNRNPKGIGAVASALASRGGELPTPDARLLAAEGFRVRCRVAFEAPGAGLVLRTLGALYLSAENRRRAAKLLIAMARPFQRFGSTYGYLEARLGGATATIRGDGQRLAILPLALAATMLLDGRLSQRGCLTPVRAIDDDGLLMFLDLHGNDVSIDQR